MRRLLIVVPVLICGAAIAAILLVRSDVSGAQILPRQGHGNTDSAAARGLAAPLSRFGIGLLAREAALDAGNVVVSPASLHAALSMLLVGAAGETAAEMRTALQLEDVSTQDLNQGWADLITNAQYGKNPELQIADSLWLKKGLPFLDSFIDLNRDYYAAEIGELLPDPATAADAINAWVAERTAGKIKQLVTKDSFTPDSLLALVNTIHLKVRWTHFDPEATELQPFTLADGGSKNVQMMQAWLKKARALSTGQYDAACLRTEGPADVWVIVPKGAETPESVLDGMQTDDGFTKLVSEAVTSEGSVALPRLSLKYTAKDLRQDMEAVGMERAFDPELAQFPGVADVKPLYVESIVQKTTLDMDEKGVEAAAATGVIVGTTAAPADPFTVRADRPYLLVITEHRSGAPLFMALVRDPS